MFPAFLGGGEVHGILIIKARVYIFVVSPVPLGQFLIVKRKALLFVVAFKRRVLALL